MEFVNNLGYDQKFDLYVYGFFASAVIMLLIAAIGFGAPVSARAWSLLAGVAIGGYGVWLAFLDTSNTYRVYYYAYIVPIVAIVNLVKSRNERKKAAESTQATPPAA